MCYSIFLVRMKRIIAKLFGQRKKSQHVDLSTITSVLLKPIGDAVGDSIVHIAHLKQLKDAFPYIKIGVIVSSRNEAIYRQSGLVDTLLEDHFINYLLQRRGWDLYLDFMPTYTSRAIILDAALQPKIVINFGKKEKKYYTLKKVQNYDFSVQTPEFTHIKDYLKYSPLSPFLSSDEIYYTFPPIPNINNNRATNRLRILLNPQGSNRQLPASELKTLLEAIQPIFHSRIELLLTNTLGSESYLSQLKDSSQIPVHLAPKTDILQYFALVASADIVVAVDSGGVHIACTYGKPLLAFYANDIASYSRWAINPKKGVNALMLISQNPPANDNTRTWNFDLQKAATWLNHEIERQLAITVNRK